MVYDRVITGKTVRLRSIEEKDAEITFKMRSDPQKSRVIHASSGTVEDQRLFIRRQREKPGDYLFVVEDLKGTPIGMKGIYDFDSVKRTVESGRYLGFGSQIQNIEAFCLGLDFAFDYLDVDTVRMSALEMNFGMLSIQNRVGATTLYRKFNEDFGCDSVYSILTRTAYRQYRPEIIRLVDRFALRK